MSNSAPHQRFDYGRKLGDFAPGEVYIHPFEITVDEVIAGPYGASFIDAQPLTSSDRAARSLGLSKRPVSPHLLLNLGLSTSVHDVSQQAIAHLAYVDVRFPKPLPVGGTVRGASRVISAKASSKGDKGVVHVQTVLVDESNERVLDFERKALIRAGTLPDRPVIPSFSGIDAAAAMGHTPGQTFGDRLSALPRPSDLFAPQLFGAFEDFEVGMRLCHANGRTVAETEHMQLSAVCRNSHPLHWDRVYSADNSFTKERVVYGGLVLAWTVTQASLDVGGHVVWDQQWFDGAHPAPVMAGDTIFAATEVRGMREVNDWCGEVELRMVGIKNERPERLLAEGRALFTAERGKDRADRITNKVVEITRRVLVRRRQPTRIG